jgi:hypothetical protein
MWPISTRVNKPENDDPSIVEPIGLSAGLARHRTIQFGSGSLWPHPLEQRAIQAFNKAFLAARLAQETVRPGLQCPRACHLIEACG